eukprot:850030_1
MSITITMRMRLSIMMTIKITMMMIKLESCAQEENVHYDDYANETVHHDDDQDYDDDDQDYDDDDQIRKLRTTHNNNNEDEHEESEVELNELDEEELTCLQSILIKWSEELNAGYEITNEMLCVFDYCLKHKEIPETIIFQKSLTTRVMKAVKESWIWRAKLTSTQMQYFPSLSLLNASKLITCLAQRFNCDLMVAGVALLVGTSSVMGPAKIDKSASFSVPANIFAAICGKPSTNKSHVVKCVISYVKKNLLIGCEQADAQHYYTK